MQVFKEALSMIGGKRVKTLREAKKEKRKRNAIGGNNRVYKTPNNRVNKYFVGTSSEWLNL